MMNVADDRLRTGFDRDMFDPDSLLALASHPGQRFDLSSEGSLQLDGQIAEGLRVAEIVRTCRTADKVSGKRMASGHLHR
ncbi:hypothetical protein ACQKJZ_15410 [Sphingomonas sp. NPDC019816]|uniref:hypothetical protein n=1 Tax=Sphingomonas sp. NPDC019816 TaxID=3390679 RepID=UPI003D00E82A